MKLIKAFVCAAFCAVVVASAASASAQSIQQGVITVVRIEGEARYSSPDGVWHPLAPGKALGAGDVIQTGAGSTADLVLGDKSVQVSRSTPGAPIGGVINIAGLPQFHTGHQQSMPEQNIIHLQSDTTLAVDKFTFSKTGADTVSDTELDLRSGKIFGNVKKISAASQYIIKMPGGVAGIRGTIFTLGANGSLTVLQGSVVVSAIGSNGQVLTTVLSPGDQFDPQTGQVVRLRPNELVAAILNANKIIIAIHSTVTVVETTAANGQDSTVIYISPNRGHG